MLAGRTTPTGAMHGAIHSPSSELKPSLRQCHPGRTRLRGTACGSDRMPLARSTSTLTAAAPVR
eukprot:scaffold3808_cov112-Isochrysis_galbana.AAC.35